MPPRIARSSLPSSFKGRSNSTSAVSSSNKSKGNRKRKQRSQNAFAIAQKLEPERANVRQHRLGDIEEDGPRPKRRRTGDDEDEENDYEDEKPQRKITKGKFEELDIDEGSDSEGHEWRMGHVDQDDDSELDSDEAFGESDEEKFEGFTFRGSTGGGGKAKKGKKVKIQEAVEMDLNEDEEEGEEEGDDDSLGEDAIDLADMLDASGSEDENEDGVDIKLSSGNTKKNAKASKAVVREASGQDLGQGFESEDEDEEDTGSEDADEESVSGDDETISSMSDVESEDNDPERLKQLDRMLSTLPKSNRIEANDSDMENNEPTAESLLAALKGMQGMDPSLTRSINKLSRSTDRTSKGKKDGLVQVPLPKRQQDKLDRVAAYDKAKDTLNRWIDTVKHNRRAEHLAFPLIDPHAQEAPGTSKMLPTEQEAPRTDLEAKIQSILYESGLASRYNEGKDAQTAGYDELPANKQSLEQVQARRAELRKARELLQREEARAKRIKKIKSKSYRRVHRKEEAKAAQKERDLMTAAGIDLSEDEKEKNDRRRAEERMGARHRESKWAKGMKKSGRAVWDDDARAGVTEMARRNEDLTKRMEGKPVRGSYYYGSDVSEEESEDDDLNEEATDFKLRSQLNDLADGSKTEAMSKLGAMAFMQRADAAQRRRNDDDVERLRRELAGEDTPSESEEETLMGRKIFGPKVTDDTPAKKNTNRNELEEGFSSEDEEIVEPVALPVMISDATLTSTNTAVQSTKPKQKLCGPAAKAQAYVDGAQAKATNNAVYPEDLRSSEAKVITDVVPLNTNGWTKVELLNRVEVQAPAKVNGISTTSAGVSDDENSEGETPFIPSDSDLIKSAFGGDDVESDFEKEKRAAAESEDEKVVDNTLPGWGSWAGEGISKREQKRNKAYTKGKFLTKTDGIKPTARKDTKLERVIVSERRVKKNAKYLASTLPHPFESRAQYERSLRLPVGPEWTTKETFQNATKPRVIVKQGIIKPMSTPML